MPLVEHLSVSKLTTYMLCPKKFRLRYLDKIEAESRSTPAAFGTAVHSAISWWQRELIDGRRPEAEEAKRIFRSDWAAEWLLGDLDLGECGALGWEALGGRLVELFAGAVDVVPDVVDVRFEVPLARGGEELPVPLVGFLDYAAGDVNGEVKTSARKAGPSQWWLQLNGYTYALGWEGVDCSVDLVVLTKTKEPQMYRHAWRASSTDIDAFLDVAFGVYRAIEAGVFYPNPGWMCGSCEFQRHCRGKKK